MEAGQVLVALIGGGGILAGVASAVTAWSNRRMPERTVAVAEVEAALKVLGATIDRIEAENKTLHLENDRLNVLVAQLRSEVDRLRIVIEPGGAP